MANAICWAIANGDWTNSATWADGRIPDTSGTDAVYTNGFTVNVNTNINVASLNNTSRSASVVPFMSANSTPIPYIAAADSFFSSGFEAYRAFNGNFDGANDRWLKTGTSGWLSMDFGSGIVINGYSVTGTTTQTANPRNWTFEGSNNNSTWTVLHTVTNGAGISGMYKATNIGNVTSYRYYRINISLNGGGTQLGISEFELFTGTAGTISVGGSFNFNTAGVTASVTSVSHQSTLFTLSTSGTATLNVTNGFPNWGNPYNIINASGGGTYTISGSFNGGIANNTAKIFINLTSGSLIYTGDITISTTNTSQIGISISSNSNVTINGNLSSSCTSVGGSGVYAVQMSGTGILTVNGNCSTVSASGTATTAAIYQTSGTVIVNGIISTGSSNSSSYSILIIGGITYINGNISTSTSVPAIFSSAAISLFITGNITASATANAISLTSGSAQVFLKGNMINNTGKMAIYAPRIWVDKDTAMTAQFFTSGGADRTLYSEDAFPNLPSVTNVRRNTIFGPGNGLIGTDYIPNASDVRSGVLVDNTTGTALFDTSTFLTELAASSDPIAIRIRNGITPEILVKSIAAFKK